MEKNLVYDPVAQNDIVDSSCSDSESEQLVDHYPRHGSLASYAKRGLIVGTLLVLYTIVLVGLTLRVAQQNRRVGRRFLSTPVDNDFIVYEPTVMKLWDGQGKSRRVEYFAEPSEKIDHNWHEIVEYQNIGVQEEVMKAMGREKEGIKLPDGTFYGSLMVFHHLHCLKNIYHALYPEYYGLNNMTAKAQKHWLDHTTHCLHMLKEAIMCQADTTLLTMKWSDQSITPIGNLTAPHECVNWDRLMEWVKPNSRDLSAEGWLIHPKFGPVALDGEIRKIPIGS